MTAGLDRDTRLIVIIAILIVIIVLMGAMMFYFRKKENDALYTLFRLEERMFQMERQLNEISRAARAPQRQPGTESR